MAFHWLQVEIMLCSHDRGLFAWSGLPSSYNSMFAAGPEAFLPLEGKSLIVGAHSTDPTYALTNYGLRIQLSVYDVQSIKELDKPVEDTLGGTVNYVLKVPNWWVKYELKVPELEDIHVALPPQTKYENLAIGILGHCLGHKSLAILLNPVEIGEQKYTRITTQNIIELTNSNEWKVPGEIFIG